ncbi:MAG TPA: sterol desaturase family protein [Chitinophagaceae bacterium]|nr:sterol desaturase family protein [Chitinophagaceae bacterium]
MDGYHYIKVFLIAFTAILLVYYLLPAWMSYMIFYRWENEKWQNSQIQKTGHTKSSIKREIAWSISTVLIFSILATTGVYWINQGYTKVYFEIPDRGWPYLVLSILIYIVLHDSYFYWVHRLMHWRPVFKWVHKTHHLSHTPSPFASLSFSPAEAVLQFGINLIMIFLVPLHPLAIGIFAIYNTVINTAGHTGIEIVPAFFVRNWFFKHGLTVTHHDMHHSHMNCNYGLCFDFWDRIMGTINEHYKQTYMELKSREHG